MARARNLITLRKLDSFFANSRCPDCGCAKFHQWQDGGHDIALECAGCNSKFGVQEAPFNLIERLEP